MPRAVVPSFSLTRAAPSASTSSRRWWGNTRCARSLMRRFSPITTPRSRSDVISPSSTAGSSTTPDVMTLRTSGRRIPLGNWCRANFSPPMTTVWPAFAPPP